MPEPLPGPEAVKEGSSMKFFHLSDLHIGRQLHQYSLLEDQRHILQEVLTYVEALRPDGIVIAGDIYDKPVPSAEAVALFDEFLTSLAGKGSPMAIMVISGNHDSGRRLDYAGRILERQNIYIAGSLPSCRGERLKRVTLADEFGEVDFYLLPFLKPGYVRGVLQDAEPGSYTEAVSRMIQRENIDFSKRNVLLSHQFYMGGRQEPQTCDSERFSVGGIDNVDIGSIKDFDYAALGHLHGAQQVAVPHIRYCGTLLKYSVSEAEHIKSLHVIELGPKHKEISVQELPLHPLRDVRKIKGELKNILKEAKAANREDYVSITLTDEMAPYKPKEQLEKVYSHILEIRIDNTRTRRHLEEFRDEPGGDDPLEIFDDFFQEIQGRHISKEEREFMRQIMEKAERE